MTRPPFNFRDCLLSRFHKILPIDDFHDLVNRNRDSNPRIEVRILRNKYFIIVIIRDKVVSVLAAVHALHHADQEIWGYVADFILYQTAWSVAIDSVGRDVKENGRAACTAHRARLNR